MGAVRTVSDGGGMISCDPNARPELMRNPDTRDAMFEVMERSHILLPSTSDLDFLYPELSEEAAVGKLLNANAQIIAVKRGAGGVTIVGNGDNSTPVEIQSFINTHSPKANSSKERIA